MVDFRNILERGKSNYTVVFNRLSPRNKGVFKAAYNYINDAFPKLENSISGAKYSADDIDTIISTSIGGIIVGVNETYKKYDGEVSEEALEELDLDSEESPFEVPSKIINEVIEEAKDVIIEELSEMAKEFASQLKDGDENKILADFSSILNLPSAANLMSYLVGLTAGFYYSKAKEMEEADERKEPLPRVKFDESGFSSSFQDEYKMEKWFDNLRK